MPSSLTANSAHHALLLILLASLLLLSCLASAQQCGGSGQVECRGVVQASYSGANCTGAKVTSLYFGASIVPERCYSGSALDAFTCGTSALWSTRTYEDVNCTGVVTYTQTQAFGLCYSTRTSSVAFFCNSSGTSTPRLPTPASGPVITDISPISECTSVDNCLAPVWKTKFSGLNCVAENATSSTNAFHPDNSLNTCYDYRGPAEQLVNVQFTVSAGFFRINGYSNGCSSGTPDAYSNAYRLGYCFNANTLNPYSYMYRYDPSRVSPAEGGVQPPTSSGSEPSSSSTAPTGHAHRSSSCNPTTIALCLILSLLLLAAQF